MRKRYRNRMTGKVSKNRSLTKIDAYDLIMISELVVGLYDWFFGVRRVPFLITKSGVDYILTISFPSSNLVEVSYKKRWGGERLFDMVIAPKEKAARKKMYNYLKDNGYLV